MAKNMTKPHIIERRFFRYCAWIQLSLWFISPRKPTDMMQEYVRVGWALVLSRSFCFLI
jgi:hypothetical protein